jgi:hypothetical protein
VDREVLAAAAVAAGVAAAVEVAAAAEGTIAAGMWAGPHDHVALLGL